MRTSSGLHFWVQINDPTRKPVVRRLEYTALLHHIGAFLTHTHYQAHTYYLIQHASLLGFDQTEIAIMATTALYHRKALPRKKYSAFAALDQRAQQIVRILSGLLRLAENLDRGHTGLVQDARLCVVDTNTWHCISTPHMTARSKSGVCRSTWLRLRRSLDDNS